MKSFERKLEFDFVMYGTAYIWKLERKWYNPMRWFFGKVKDVHIPPMQLLIRRRG